MMIRVARLARLAPLSPIARLSPIACLAPLALLALSPAPASAAPVTFSREVAPILQRHCQECHRPGQIAPMSLIGFEDARPWAKSIRANVADRKMPPWHAEPGVQDYANTRALSDPEIETLTSWVDQGAPEGDPADLPAPRTFDAKWQLGEPDLTLAMNTEYEVKPGGRDDYRCFVLDPNLTEDRWVSAVEVRPGNVAVDHHAVLYVDRQGGSLKRDAKDPQEGYRCFGGPGFMSTMLGGWGPGLDPKVYPEGVGYKIPAGAKIVMQMHYHNAGTAAEKDQTRVGLHFAQKPISRGLRDGIILNMDLDIAAGMKDYTAKAERAVMQKITVYSVIPHMHLLGKKMRMWADLPDGKRIDLVSVPNWDFDWQTEYIFKQPISVPRGAVMRLEAEFDNSAENPKQPVHPPRHIAFGESTTDEMCVGVYNYTIDDE